MIYARLETLSEKNDAWTLTFLSPNKRFRFFENSWCLDGAQSIQPFWNKYAPSLFKRVKKYFAFNNHVPHARSRWEEYFVSMLGGSKGLTKLYWYANLHVLENAFSNWFCKRLVITLKPWQHTWSNLILFQLISKYYYHILRIF